MIKHVRPALERDALEDGQHGEAEIVEIGDSRVRAFPVQVALHVLAQLGAIESVVATRMRIFHHFAIAREARSVELSGEELESDDRVDDDDEDDEEGDVE